MRQTNQELQKTHQELQHKIQKAKEEIGGDIQVTAHQAIQLVWSQEDKLARLEQLVHKLENEQLPSLNRLEERLEALQETSRLRRSRNSSRQ